MTVSCPLGSSLAEQYIQDLHWSVIALKPQDKKPLNEWMKYQSTKPSMDDLLGWLDRYGPDANIGICTGNISNIVVIDIDSQLGLGILIAMGGYPNTPTVKTGKGWHFYFKREGLDSGRILTARIGGKVTALVEARATGQYVVAPPSIHPSGAVYAWQEGKAPGEMELADVPKWVERWLLGRKDTTLNTVKKGFVALFETEEGNRNNQLNRVAFTLGRLIKQGKLEREHVEQGLWTVADLVGLTAAEEDRKTRDTIKSGLDAGIAQAEGDIAASTEIMDALKNLGWDFRLNKLTDIPEVNGERMTDVEAAKIRTAMRDLGFKSMPTIEDAYLAYAGENSYHPIEEYLLSLEWDGEDHLKRLAEHVTINHPPLESDRYISLFHLWLTKWMLGAVGRVFAQEQNFMLVLEGPQDCGKSFFAQWLASGVPREYFAALPIYTGNKDYMIRLMETWVWEVGELGSTIRKQDREALKYFITLEWPKVRKPYGRYDIVKPALTSFIGTLNDQGGFLDDPTGNRRFAVVSVADIDWAYSAEINPNQLWAQVMELYNSGERGRLDVEERQLRDETNVMFEAPDPLLDALQELFVIEPGNTKFGMHTSTILYYLEGAGFQKSRGVAMSVAGYLQKLGLEKARPIDIEGVRVRGYYGIKPRLNEDIVKVRVPGVLWDEQDEKD